MLISPNYLLGILFVVKVAVISAVLSQGYCFATDLQTEPAMDAPPIMQVLALPDGRMAVLTPEKGGLYVSASSGRSWRKWAEVPEVFIHQMALGPDQTLYLATPGGLLRWDDARRIWEQVAGGSVGWIFFGSPGLNSESDLALVKKWGRGLFGVPTRVLSPSQLQEERTGREKDREPGADSWIALKQVLPDTPFQSAVIRADNELFAATFGRGVFRSRSAGAPWEPVSLGLVSPRVLTLAASPWGELYAGTYGGGLFRWHNDIARWNMVDPMFTGADIQELAFGPKGEILAASAERGLFLSLDQGRSWRRMEADLPMADAQSVAVAADGSMWAGFWEQGLFVSYDGGASWQRRPFAAVVHVADLAFCQDGVGYAVLAGLGLFRSLDGGRQWTQLRIPVRPAMDLRLAVTAEGRLFLGSLREGLWTSSSQGETWDRDMGGLTGDGVRAVVVSPAGTVLAIPSDASGLYVRSGSDQWRVIPLVEEEGRPYSVWEIVFLPDNRGVAAGYMDMLLSDDGGETWKRKHFGQPYRALAVDTAGTIYSQRMMSTFALQRGEEKWETVPAIPLDAYRFFRPLSRERWVAARQENGVDFLHRQDTGLIVAESGLMNRWALSLGVGPDGAVFAGFQDGMMVTRDMGTSWQPVEVVEE
ncbi:sialidase family protein [Desulfobulbus alkaliphilus]|uniref:sialidase family protein n=1 Tax=Desulfobulbus alkaliphilus TaxID=869814 RepID=UPI00196345D7|nr:hypothetical protein [Desulfobulbus alkaliphilus]MBM9536230.1 hypothetical protein [Desulfobulbus alkaliphilus]